MRRTTRWIGLFSILGAVALFTGEGRVRAGGFGGFGGGGFNLRQIILGRVQEQVIIPDEEWAVIEPKLWKVVTLQIVVGGDTVGPGASLLQRAAARNGGQLLQEVDPAIMAMATELRQSESNLQAALDDPNGTENQIQIKLREYRVVRDRARLALATAQADLQRILTLRQEAMLIVGGYME